MSHKNSTTGSNNGAELTDENLRDAIDALQTQGTQIVPSSGYWSALQASGYVKPEDTLTVYHNLTDYSVLIEKGDRKIFTTEEKIHNLGSFTCGDCNCDNCWMIKNKKEILENL